MTRFHDRSVRVTSDSGVRVPEEILDSNLRLLLQSERPSSTHQAFSRQDDLLM